jgi:hypothetical protein
MSDPTETAQGILEAIRADISRIRRKMKSADPAKMLVLNRELLEARKQEREAKRYV